MNVLIIEDDPMVDFIHRNYLEKTALLTLLCLVIPWHLPKIYLLPTLLT